MKHRYHDVSSRSLCIAGIWLLALDFLFVIWWAS